MGLDDLAPWDVPDLSEVSRPPGPNPRVAVVIPARNAARHLAEQLEALEAQDYEGPWEVVVVDDGSTDGTRAVAEGFRERLPALQVISVPEPVGSPAARNIGAKSTDADILCFCDADDRVSTRWISAFVEALASAPAGAGPMHPSDHPDRDTQPWGRSPAAASHASSANFAMRADLWRALGGFREDYPSHLSELDLSWRLQRGGLAYVSVPDAEIWYRIRDDAWSLWRQRVRWGVEQALARRVYGAEYMPHPGVLSTLRAYVSLVARLPLVVSSRRRREWIKGAGLRLGRLVGSVRYRVLYL